MPGASHNDFIAPSEAGIFMHSRAPSASQIGSADGRLSTPRFPIRVFLLSSCPLLREMIVHLLKSQTSILLIGTQNSSALAVPEMIASNCDVLLTDRGELSSLGVQSLDELRRSSPNLKISFIDMNAGIADLLSGILQEAY